MPIGVYIRTQQHLVSCKKGAQKRSLNPEWRRNQKIGAKKRIQNSEWIFNVTNANKKKSQDPEWRHKQKEGAQILSQDPEWRRKQKEAGERRALSPKWQQNHKIAMQNLSHNSEWLIKNKEIREAMYQDPEWKRKIKEGARNKNRDFYQDPNWKLNITNANKKKSQDPEWRRKQKEGAQRRSQKLTWKYNHKIGAKNKNRDFLKDPEWKRKIKDAGKQRSNDYEWLLKNKEGKIGGFWYGNVNNNERKYYCELWNKDLWNRIDVFQNFKSILSDKTKEDNGGHALSRHHVYWQEKACCIWDEDDQGYYAMINIGGSRVNPQMYKYYVNGDPNKFVLLTRSEHAMIAKDKIKWIKIFEELIKNKFNDKCYYTKEEYTYIVDKIGGIV